VRLVAYTDAPIVGGADISLGNLVAELDGSIDVALLAVHPAVAETVASRRPGMEARVLAAPRHKADVARIAAHVRAVRKLRPDILHVNLYSPWAGQYAILSGVLTRTPVIAVEQVVFGTPTPLRRRFRQVLCSRLAAHVAVGERAARNIERLIGLTPGELEVVYNGVPDVPLRPVERRRAGPVVGGVGRLSTQKGFDVLIRALVSLPEASLVLVGEGPERAALEGLARELGVDDRLEITGWVENPRDHLAGFDVVAQPSRFEGFPLAVVEAMLASRPVVAAAVESIPEAVDHETTGLLVAPDDPDALGAAIASLLADPDRREAMGRHGRERALRRFTADIMARSYEEIYRRVLGRHA
jgi:glycosyltransferase involved in cell wall biosynthesis